MKCNFFFILSLVGTVMVTGCGRKEDIIILTDCAPEPALVVTEAPLPSPTVVMEAEIPRTIFIDVCGAVRSPGVYQIPEGSRVFQAVEAAGGFSEEAAPDLINLARVLADEQQVRIPTEEERESAESNTAGSPEDAYPYPEEPEQRSDGKINLNTAGLEQLITLNGIGETRARAILDYRETHGPFASAEEIMHVQGIKEGTFVKIKDQIVVE
ncbi:MAG: helix-hairpin-helix domain-containing protein [Clostridiales bacterium]|nr:helix-hairpin-helix domain-containing protein [Candidatus Blautia equi]